MTDDREALNAAVDFLGHRLAELTEMLTAATDVAVQRGKVLDELRAWYGEPVWVWARFREILGIADDA